MLDVLKTSLFASRECLPALLMTHGEKKTLVVKANGEFPMSSIHPVFVPSTASEVMSSLESY